VVKCTGRFFTWCWLAGRGRCSSTPPLTAPPRSSAPHRFLRFAAACAIDPPTGRRRRRSPLTWLAGCLVEEIAAPTHSPGPPLHSIFLSGGGEWWPPRAGRSRFAGVCHRGAPTVAAAEEEGREAATSTTSSSR